MKIRLVHILNNIDGERETKSIENISRLKNIGIEYIQQITPLYEGNAHNEIKPLTWNYPEHNHNKRHYGNYSTYKQAIKDNFSEELDALIVCECDTYLELSNEEFLQEIEKTLNFCKKYDTYHFSWGGYCSKIFHTDDEYPDYCLVDRITLAHFNIFPKNSRNFYLHKIDNFGWDAADIWLNEMIQSGLELEFEIKDPIRKQAITQKNFSKQIKGVSYLDNMLKGEDINEINYSDDVEEKNNKIIVEYVDGYAKVTSEKFDIDNPKILSFLNIEKNHIDYSSEITNALQWSKTTVKAKEWKVILGEYSVIVSEKFPKKIITY